MSMLGGVCYGACVVADSTTCELYGVVLMCVCLRRCVWMGVPAHVDLWFSPWGTQVCKYCALQACNNCLSPVHPKTICVSDMICAMYHSGTCTCVCV